MKRSALLALLWVLLGTSLAQAGGEIYGTITTLRGDKLTGPIRWDVNENFWDDVLDARKPQEGPRKEGFRLTIFGWDLIRASDSGHSYHQLTIPFGHIRAIEPTWDGGGKITLKSGEEIEARKTADLPPGRDLEIVDATRGSVEVEWGDVERIEFRQGPGEGRDADRLYGPVETGRGTFTGFVVWDRDESLREDVLDGYDEKDRSHEIPFAEIEWIEKVDGRSCRVHLNTGAQLVLSETNDVNSSIRGIDVTVPGLGRVELDWDQFDKVTFVKPPASRRYADFDGGGKLRGKVNTADGRTLNGSIVWDLDEEYTWEFLDGEQNGIEYSILFENIRSLAPSGRYATTVELKNGDTLTLEESTDVDYSNRGILVNTSAGETHQLAWRDLRSVVFD